MYVKTAENKSVEVKLFPETTVAYVRYVGPYKGDEQLIVYHDNPEITDEDKLRVSVCIGVPEDTEVSGEIGKMTILKGKYVLAQFGQA